MKTLLGEGWWSFITRGRLKDGGVHKLLLILGAALIGEKRLKEGERLLEDLPYIYIYILFFHQFLLLSYYQNNLTLEQDYYQM